MQAIALTNKNISTVALCLNISTSDLLDKVNQSKLDHIHKQNFEYILSFFNEDEAWYQKTKAAVEEIKNTLPDKMDYKMRTIKIYGWIKNETTVTGSLSIPMELDQEYSESRCIEMVFNGQIDIYLKILNWD